VRSLNTFSRRPDGAALARIGPAPAKIAADCGNFSGSTGVF
jgi:hypothetical protein